MGISGKMQYKRIKRRVPYMERFAVDGSSPGIGGEQTYIAADPQQYHLTNPTQTNARWQEFGSRPESETTTLLAFVLESCCTSLDQQHPGSVNSRGALCQASSRGRIPSGRPTGPRSRIRARGLGGASRSLQDLLSEHSGTPILVHLDERMRMLSCVCTGIHMGLFLDPERACHGT